MAAVNLTGVRRTFGPVVALDSVDLSLPSGQLLAVLGPSGCGKTTLLRCIAGFEAVEAGRIVLDGTEVATARRHVAVHRRKVSVVPQEGALFPHLSVEQNVAFGLPRDRRRPGRVAEVLELVGLGGYGARMPHELSGGQQQRVAVARALAPRPPVVLLDEPFSALDASLRAGLRRDVRAALREDGATALLVTHDQAEALSMADQVAVMRDGRILQSATPSEVYRWPADAWVARFVGDAMLVPVTGVGPGRTRASRLGPVRIGSGPVDLEVPLLVLIRPEQVRVRSAVSNHTRTSVPATVSRVAYHGHDTLARFDLGDGHQAPARVAEGPDTSLEVGQSVRLSVEGEVRAFARTAPEAVPTSE